MIGTPLWGSLGVSTSGRMTEVNILLYLCGVVTKLRHMPIAQTHITEVMGSIVAHNLDSWSYMYVMQ